VTRMEHRQLNGTPGRLTGEEGILLRPACVWPVEVYAPERKAEFLLNNAVTPEDYAWAVKEVRKMELDPEAIPHDPPPGVSNGPGVS